MGDNVAAIFAVLVLIAALIVPLFLLMRTQKATANEEEAAEAAKRNKEQAAIDKKQAKLERGVGKKKKGALSKMKKNMDRADQDEDNDVPGQMGDAADDEEDEDGPKSRREQRKADKKAAKDEDREYANEKKEAVKEREAAKDEKRRLREEAQAEKDRLRDEAEKNAKEEEEKRKQEEYDQWKDMFSVEEGGEEEVAGEADEGLLGRFVDYIKQQKVSVLEDLAAEFGLKVQDVINRVQGLEQMGYITGVVDDRGKFIFIAQEELDAVAKHINKKGRIRISDLAHESNKLIDLTPRALIQKEAEAEEDAAEAAAAEAAAAAGPAEADAAPTGTS